MCASRGPCATIRGSRIAYTTGGGVDFCVQGDTLFILDGATYPELAVVKPTREVETADAAPSVVSSRSST